MTVVKGYETVIGLEIHVQLRTDSKMFCRCSNVIAASRKDAEIDAEGRGISSRTNADFDTEPRGQKLEEPNTRVCPVCLGMPGTLPVANKKAVEWTILLGLALNAKIPERFNFERKNYFYPDLPKGYQISSATNPPVKGGSLEIETLRQAQGRPGIKKIRLNHIHPEEDAGKLIHEEGKDYSLVDLNRAGTPLLEIVTEPDISSPEEAKVFLQSLRGILRYLRISDAEMEKGQMRCDANISLKKKGAEELGTKVEIKNLNSFKMVERSLEYEIERQKEVLNMNNKVVQETRGWNDAKGKSISQRTKEEAMDYRYFSEPDLPPIVVGGRGKNAELDADKRRKKSGVSQKKTQNNAEKNTDFHGYIDIEEIRKLIPELPKEKRERFKNEYGLNEKDSFTLTADHKLANFFEKTLEEIPEIVKGSEVERNYAKKISNWMLNELLARLNARNQTIEETKVEPKDLALLIELIEGGTVSGKIAKEIFDEMFESGKEPSKIIEERGIKQISGIEELDAIIVNIIRAHPKSVEDFRNGKEVALGFLVGQVMKETGGKANPTVVNELLRKRLGS